MNAFADAVVTRFAGRDADRTQGWHQHAPGLAHPLGRANGSLFGDQNVGCPSPEPAPLSSFMMGSAVVFPRWTSDSEMSLVSLGETLFWFLFVVFLSWAWGTSAKIFWGWLAQPTSQEEKIKERRVNKEKNKEPSLDVP